MKVLVVDNEKNARSAIISLVDKFCENIESINEASGLKSGIDAISNNSPDVVLLDIELDDGTGLDLLSELNEINFQLIFITAHHKYALEAFKLSAIDFLLKPITSHDLIRAFKKAQDVMDHEVLKQQLKFFQETLNQVSYNDKKIVLRDSESIYFVKINDIIRCEASSQYTEFYLTKKKIVVSKPLKEYEEILNPFGFIRTHHSHLVNKYHIDRYQKADGGCLILLNEEVVPISQRKRNFVFHHLKLF